MKALTLRLGQFAIGALSLTVLFRYALNLCIGINSIVGTTLCSILYFALMFLTGWWCGVRDEAEYGIHDIGFRFHCVTYLICIGLGYAAHYIGWHTESLRALTITALCWGIGLLVHLALFLIERGKTIRGYAKEEIFQ